MAQLCGAGPVESGGKSSVGRGWKLFLEYCSEICETLNVVSVYSKCEL